MKTTRQRIVDFIETRQAASPAEIAAALKMTAANARHHLTALADEGVVQVVGERTAQKRGRPAQLYRLTSIVSAHALDVMAAALLRQALRQFQAGGGEDWAVFLDRLAEAMAEQMRGPQIISGGRSLTLRLQAAVRKLAAYHYQPRWEAHAVGPRLILAHCPYGSLPAEFPQVCQLDQRLIGNLLGSPVICTTIQEAVAPGIRQCVFVVK